jgi:PPM family protein phosphatase
MDHMMRMTIGDFARVSGLTPKALRLYDELGLLRPAAVDEVNGYRYYEPEQLDRARLVARLRLIGMPLERIRRVADLPAASRSAALLSYWRQAEADHASRREQVAVLVEQSRGKEAGMLMDQTIHPSVASRVGVGRRDHQLDALTIGTRLFAVADGFGTPPSPAADVLDAIEAYDDLHGSIDPVMLLDEAVTRAAATVADRPGSGCTLTAVMLGDSQVAVAHVGDSRLFLIREAKLQRLTHDHTFVQSLVDEGRLTPEEARAHDDRALLNRAIAPETPLAPDISMHHTRPGDRFVLTTDGVHGVLPAALLADLLTQPTTAEGVASSVEAAVLDADAPDNYCIIALDLP